MLDAAYPLYLPLRRLLVRLSEVYPLTPHVPAYGRPKKPPKKAWEGDRHVLFGSPIPTTILLSLGVYGWTFEALCCAVAIGHHRENVKKVLRRLEEEGVLEADRPRGPGFCVRVVTISEDFPAKKELMALIRAYIRVWPSVKSQVELAMRQLPPRTKAHLRRRDLLDDGF